MKTTQKGVFQKAVNQFTNTVIKRGIIQSFDPGSYTASIQMIDSGNTVVQGIPVARNVDPRSMSVGNRVYIITFDPNNPGVSIIAGTYTGTPGGPNTVSSYASGPTVSTAANDTSTYVSIAPSQVTLATGQGQVMTRLDLGLYINGASGSGGAYVRIKCTLNPIGGSPTVIYLPNTVGWYDWIGVNNDVNNLGFSVPLSVPSGQHTFVAQFRAAAVPSGGYITWSTACACALSVTELT